MRETHEPTILKRRSRASALEGDANQDLEDHGIRVQQWLKSIPLARPAHMFLVEPVVTMLSIYIALTFAIIYCFSTSLPFAFDQVYGFSPEEQGLVFLSLVVGYIVSGPTTVIPYLLQQRSNKVSSSIQSGESPPIAPERLLFPAMFGSVGLPISFFWFGWSAKADVHWSCPVVAVGLFAWGNNLIYVSLHISFIDL